MNEELDDLKFIDHVYTENIGYSDREYEALNKKGRVVFDQGDPKTMSQISGIDQDVYTRLGILWETNLEETYKIGDSLRIVATSEDISNDPTSVVWESSDYDVAYVFDGNLVSFVGAGSVDLIGTDVTTGHSETITVTVE